VAWFILDGLFREDASKTSNTSNTSDSSNSSEPPVRTYVLAPFQEAAVGRVRGILERRGGAILADAVGLGKTYVALALIEERFRGGDDVVVVIPAALRGLWLRPLRRLERNAGGGPAVRLVSHAQMSRGVAIREPRGGRLVVVDEAHRFRNPATRRYGALARLLDPPDPPPDDGDRHYSGPGPRPPRPPRPDVLLITATPINNAVDDLFHLVRLFLRDDGLRDAGVPSLRGAFEPPGGDPAAVQGVVRELVVRRSRAMVDARYGGAGPVVGVRVAFPERAPPRIHRYRSPETPVRVATIEALELAAYGPGAAPLLRLGLLKRLDSSPRALAVSVGRVREYLAAFRDAAAAGRLLRPGDRRIGGDDDPFQLLLLGVVAEPAPPELDLAGLVAATERDLVRLEELTGSGPGRREGTGRREAPRTGGRGGAGSDPKLQALIDLLHSVEGERVLVFTEYRDTAEALWRTLLPQVRVGRIDGSGAWLGGSPAGRRRVVERFAPAANGRRAPPARERVDVLVATDVLAEGLNLQDARHVVSYDLPWNPVRLLQRIGRVDRLGSLHDIVVPHLFVPAEGLDAVLGLTRRLRAKLHGIAGALGEERADELLAGLAAGPAADLGDRVEASLRAVAREAPDPIESLRTLWVRSGAAGWSPMPEARRQLEPWVGQVGMAGSGVDLDAMALVEHAGRAQLLELHRDGRVTGPTAAGVRVLGAGLAADGVEEQSPERVVRVVHGIEAYFRRQAALDSAPPPVPPRQPGARLARRVRRAVADAGAGVAPETVARAEAVLAALSVPLRPVQERAVSRVLEERSSCEANNGPARFLERMEDALAGVSRDPAEYRKAAGKPPRIQAMLLVRKTG
jgi:hypothetical protein